MRRHCWPKAKLCYHREYWREYPGVLAHHYSPEGQGDTFDIPLLTNMRLVRMSSVCCSEFRPFFYLTNGTNCKHVPNRQECVPSRQKTAFMCASKQLHLLKIRNIFFMIIAYIHPPKMKNTLRDKVHLMFFIVSYVFVLCETALNANNVSITRTIDQCFHNRSQQKVRLLNDFVEIWVVEMNFPRLQYWTALW